jgi:hypothetical protein
MQGKNRREGEVGIKANDCSKQCIQTLCVFQVLDIFVELSEENSNKRVKNEASELKQTYSIAVDINS